MYEENKQNKRTQKTYRSVGEVISLSNENGISWQSFLIGLPSFPSLLYPILSYSILSYLFLFYLILSSPLLFTLFPSQPFISSPSNLVHFLPIHSIQLLLSSLTRKRDTASSRTIFQDYRASWNFCRFLSFWEFPCKQIASRIPGLLVPPTQRTGCLRRLSWILEKEGKIRTGGK